MVTTKILTVPNVLTVLRLLGVPLFFYLVLGPEADGWAVILLGISGATD
ncbi:MAG TPA: CDP-alcohol phosphatidyltransferase family protein, partial [Actinomycetes bacterium]